MKYQLNKKIFLTFLIFLNIIFFIVPNTALAVTCLCSGEVRSGQANYGSGGGTGYDPKRDFPKLEKTIEKEPVVSDFNIYMRNQVDCQLAIERKYNSPTTHFFGTCEVTALDDEDVSATQKNLIQKMDLRKPILEIIIPDLKFTELKNTVDQYGNIQVPWIGEYIKAIYNLAVTVASILGVVMLIREGLRIVLSAGGDEKVQGYKNIGRVLTGLVLAWLSYVILYNLNSDLVGFRALNVKYVSEDAIPPDDTSEASTTDITDTAKQLTEYYKKNPTSTNSRIDVNDFKICPWSSGTNSNFSCSEWAANRQGITRCGVSPRKNLTTTNCDGKLKTQGGSPTTATVLPPMATALCKAVDLAEQEGYSIRLSSSWRSFEEQADGWCKKGVNRQARAAPGYSNHGLGKAVDVYLYKDGKKLTIFGYNAQCDTLPENARKLAEFFYKADSNFHRLEKELWHFEYGGKVDGAHGIIYDLPKHCPK